MRDELTEIIATEERHQGHQLDLSVLKLNAEDIPLVIEYLNAHPEITALDLSFNDLGAEGARAFAKRNTTVTTLNLTSNKIGAEGTAAFAEHNTTVTTLDLSDNEISDAGVRDFAKKNTVVTTLKLLYNFIGNAGMPAFAERNTMVATLNLAFNGIGADGAAAFVERNTTVTTLNLSFCHIDDEAVRDFAQHNKFVTTLNLQGCDIGNAGANAFAEHNTTVTELDISNNFGISLEAHQRVADSLKALRVSIIKPSVDCFSLMYLSGTDEQANFPLYFLPELQRLIMSFMLGDQLTFFQTHWNDYLQSILPSTDTVMSMSLFQPAQEFTTINALSSESIACVLTETLNAQLEEAAVQSIRLDAQGLWIDCVSDEAANSFQTFCTDRGLQPTCEAACVRLMDAAQIDFFLDRICKVNPETVYKAFEDNQSVCLIC